MVQPLVKHKIVKKRTKRFKRHQADRYDCVDDSWRRPKGIDSRVRRRFRSLNLLPSIGYGTNKKTRHMGPDGFLKFLVRSPQDLEILLMHNRKYSAEIAHNLSVQKRKVILARAEQLNIKVTNPNARVRQEETE
mmetsp:Transcript_36210/g.35149  ORF Transcript_36210/g.35149 Transcript_36210/m.35149 type:complete len:134 (-) Transcript_36210:117-518(-)